MEVNAERLLEILNDIMDNCNVVDYPNIELTQEQLMAISIATSIIEEME